MTSNESVVNMSTIILVIEKLRLIIAEITGQVNEPTNSSYHESVAHIDKAVSTLQGVTNEYFDPAIRIDTNGILHIGGMEHKGYLTHDDIHALKTLGKL